MTDPITRLNAALEGRYRIERQLGEGGMATVYLARDEKHNRNVALKVLKPELAAVVGAERFLAEIETTANLQHPHILPLFDSGEADSFLFYVMPYVEGESLRERLDREHQLPVDEAVQIAKDVAEALQAAHDQGVIHRDVKPANILLSKGRPLVSDFGIALALGAAGAGRLTETGLSLGTPHYMSPEQATGDLSVGAATDIYALGCVLYEMLVAEPPYTGGTPQAILGKIVTGDAPSASAERRSVPPNVDAAIRKALEKVPADRFAAAGELARALADPAFTHGALPVSSVGAAVGPWNRLSVGATGLAALLMLALVWTLLGPDGTQPVSRMVLSPGEWQPLDFRYVALAPDGSSMIVPIDLATGEPQSLGLKLRDEAAITPIPGTEGGRDVVYSPDGEWIAYARGGDLFKQRLEGGVPVRLAEDASNDILALDWLDDGTLLYETLDGSDRAIGQISEDGGERRIVFQPDESINPVWVRGLPDGRGALVSTCPGAGCSSTGVLLYAVDLESLSWELLLEGVPKAWYSPTGHIVYVRADGALISAPFDLGVLEVTGNAVPVVQGVRVPNGPVASVRLADDGTLIYVEQAVEGGSLEQLVVVDLQGNEQTLPLAPREISSVSWSPDGRSVVYQSEGQVYTYDVALNTAPRLITSEGSNRRPVFSPDGTQLAFSSLRAGTDGTDVFVKDLVDGSASRLVLSLEAEQAVMQWPADTLILVERGEAGVERDLWVVDLSDPGNPEAWPYLTSEARLERVSLSPDGTLAAYRSDESGTAEIYISGFPNPDQRTLVSSGGGRVPFWSPDGSTLYYLSRANGPFVAARLQLEPALEVLSRDSLFTISSLEPFPGSGLSPDGDRFILARGMATADGGEASAGLPRLILVQNFFTELCERTGDC